MNKLFYGLICSFHHKSLNGLQKPMVLLLFQVTSYHSIQSKMKLAREAGNVILLTKDRDFPELQQRLGAPPKIIWLRIGNSLILTFQKHFGWMPNCHHLLQSG